MISQNLSRKIKRIVILNKHLVEARHIHFSFFTRRNRIVCYGYNRVYQTHPISAKYETRFSDIHSELSAISRFPYRIKELQNYNLVNIRLRREDNQYGLSRPCIKCLQMLTEFGIKEVYYTNEFGNFSYEHW